MNELDEDELDAADTRQTFDFPQRQPWSSAAVKLLKGVVYHDDQGNTWDEILANVSRLTDYFGQLGLVLIVNQEDGLAWLHQPEPDELPADYESIPKLFHKVALGFEGTLLCVVLRDELRRSEDEDLQNDRCVIKQSDLLESWRMFFPENADDVRLNESLATQLRRLRDLKFVREFEKTPPSWEIRRILKARLPLETLRTVRSELQEELARRQRGGQ
ncbi:DUF4194 domain-containing protein [bacterium]|nr:DUF4194 domain-containing protein [bacterium]